MSKIIYLVRHGEHSCNILTTKGREEIKAAAGAIKEELTPDISSVVIYHSPKRRARESAEIIGGELSSLVAVKLCNKKELNCEDGLVHTVVDAINEPLSVVVGHKPDLEEYASRYKIPASFGRTGSYYKLV